MVLAVDAAPGGDTRHLSHNTSNRIDGVPACRGCVGRLTWYHRLDKFGALHGWIPGIILLFVIQHWIAMVFLFACVLRRADPVDDLPAVVRGDVPERRANYEFRSARVAEEFLELNARPAGRGHRRSLTRPRRAPPS